MPLDSFGLQFGKATIHDLSQARRVWRAACYRDRVLTGGLPKRNHMRNAIDDLVEREVQLPGATRQSVFDALVEFDVELFRRRARSRADERRKTYLHDRAARILLYFRHGFTSGSTTREDVRLISLIEALPKSAARSS